MNSRHELPCSAFASALKYIKFEGLVNGLCSAIFLHLHKCGTSREYSSVQSLALRPSKCYQKLIQVCADVKKVLKQVLKPFCARQVQFHHLKFPVHRFHHGFNKINTVMMGSTLPFFSTSKCPHLFKILVSFLLSNSLHSRHQHRPVKFSL